MRDDIKTFLVENARLIFRNFSGGPDRFNPNGGKKSFCVILDPKTAEAMANDGWHVKVLAPRESEEEEEGTPYIQVAVNFKNRPPNVVLITSTSRTNLNDESIGVLDWADIQTVDLIAQSYDWEVGGKAGVKAYLKSMFVTIEEDELERKYALDR